MSRTFTLIGMFLAAALTGPVLALSQSAPIAGEVTVVAALPWSGRPADMVARAGGRLVGPGTSPLAVLAISDGQDFAKQLKDAGAWLVLDGRRLSSLCGV